MFVGSVDDEGENFDCASILSSHTQDVKCVRWHPSEEVCPSHLFTAFPLVNGIVVSGWAPAAVEPTLNLGPSEMCQKILLLLEIFCPKMQNLRLQFSSKVENLSTVGNLPLSVGILSEICNSYPPPLLPAFSTRDAATITYLLLHTAHIAELVLVLCSSIFLYLEMKRLISEEKNHVDLSSVFEIRSYITEWPRFWTLQLFVGCC